MILDLYGKKFDTERPESTFANGDCVEAMKKFSDKYFDLAIVDPPYGDGGGTFLGGNGSRFGGRFDRYKDSTSADGESKRQQIEWDVAPSDDYFRELFRVSKNQIIWGGQLLQASADAMLRDMAQDKHFRELLDGDGGVRVDFI